MYRLELVRKILSLCRVDILTHFYRICNVYSRKNKKVGGVLCKNSTDFGYFVCVIFYCVQNI